MMLDLCSIVLLIFFLLRHINLCVFNLFIFVASSIKKTVSANLSRRVY